MSKLVTRFRAARFEQRTTVVVPAELVTSASVLTPAEVDQPLRVVLVGQAPWTGLDGARRWASAGLPSWAAEHERGHYLHGHTPVLHYRVNGHHVEVSQADAWFGAGTYSVDDVTAVFGYLAGQLGTLFPGAVMLGTPAATGRDCFMRSLGHREFPVMSSELQELVRSTSGQGRIETFARPGKANAVAVYDGRMMYAGCCAELGHGIPTVETGDTFEPHARARYQVRVTVPADWSHVGLLGVKDDRTGGWRWPAEPGEEFETWADGAELHLAARMGWPFRVMRRIVWPEHRGRPLDGWVNKMLTIVAQAGQLDAERRRLVERAVRSMVLASIGAFVGAPHKVSRSGPPSSMPAGARNKVIESDTLATWTELRPAAWPELAHPEWSAAVWARARLRLLEARTGLPDDRAGMLSVPVESILGCRTDAIYMTADPGWHDDGRVGRFRLVASGSFSYRRPLTNVELHALKGRCDGA